MATRSPCGRPRRAAIPKPKPARAEIAVQLTDKLIDALDVLGTAYGEGLTDAQLVERAVIESSEREAQPPRVVSGDDV